MTDKTPDKPQDDRARPSAVLTTPASKRADASSSSASGKEKRRGESKSPLVLLTLVVSLAALGFGVAAWIRQNDIQAAHDSLSRQLASTTAEHGETDAEVQRLFTQMRAQGERIESLGTELNTATGVIRDLDEALRLMTDRGSELVLLNDVDHLVTIAQQQLELGGNVRNAIVALESAQAQLARANRPALASLLQTVNGDLDRLRAASTIDIAAFSQQLEELAMLVTDAPLIMPDKISRTEEPAAEQVQREQPAPTVPPAESAADTWWERAFDTSREWAREAWGSLRSDLGDFIEVRRVDDASALLMSPDQAARFRESLRTRIMTAQLALMMRQVEVWRTETEAIVKAIETRYDESSSMTRRALRLARTMADAPIDTQLPTVNNTLQALEALREEQGRLFGDTETDESRNGQGDQSSTHGTQESEPGQSESGTATGQDGPGKPEQDGSSQTEQGGSGQTEQDGSGQPQGQEGTEQAAGEGELNPSQGPAEPTPPPQPGATQAQEQTAPEQSGDRAEAQQSKSAQPEAQSDSPQAGAEQPGAAQSVPSVPGVQPSTGG